MIQTVYTLKGEGSSRALTAFPYRYDIACHTGLREGTVMEFGNEPLLILNGSLTATIEEARDLIGEWLWDKATQKRREVMKKARSMDEEALVLTLYDVIHEGKVDVNIVRSTLHVEEAPARGIAV